MGMIPIKKEIDSPESKFERGIWLLVSTGLILGAFVNVMLFGFGPAFSILFGFGPAFSILLALGILIYARRYLPLTLSLLKGAWDLAWWLVKAIIWSPWFLTNKKKAKGHLDNLLNIFKSTFVASATIFFESFSFYNLDSVFNRDKTPNQIRLGAIVSYLVGFGITGLMMYAAWLAMVATGLPIATIIPVMVVGGLVLGHATFKTLYYVRSNFWANGLLNLKMPKSKSLLGYLTFTNIYKASVIGIAVSAGIAMAALFGPIVAVATSLAMVVLFINANDKIPQPKPVKAEGATAASASVVSGTGSAAVPVPMPGTQLAFPVPVPGPGYDLGKVTSSGGVASAAEEPAAVSVSALPSAPSVRSQQLQGRMGRFIQTLFVPQSDSTFAEVDDEPSPPRQSPRNRA